MQLVLPLLSERQEVQYNLPILQGETFYHYVLPSNHTGIGEHNDYYRGYYTYQTQKDALVTYNKYLDEAIVAGIRSVHLIHGKGTGALKMALWKFLKGDKRITSFRIGQFGEGDGGVTVVEMK